jgi:hypothetical protein
VALGSAVLCGPMGPHSTADPSATRAISRLYLLIIDSRLSEMMWTRSATIGIAKTSPWNDGW